MRAVFLLFSLLVTSVVAVAVGACDGSVSRGAHAAAPPPARPSSDPPLKPPNASPDLPPPEPPALEGPPLSRVDLGGGHVAYVALPVGARDRRSIVVGVHGAGDHADWSCSEWQATTANWPIVVCPQGVTHPVDRSAFLWGSAESIAESAERAVAFVRAHYAPWIADVPLVYAGWSQGASLAASVVAQKPGVYDRVVLVELGHTPINPNAVASSLVRGGIKRAVVSCSSVPCRSFAAGFEAAARQRALPVQTNDVGLRGHWFDEPVFRTLGPKFAWMVEDDARYAGLVAAIDARWSTD